MNCAFPSILEAVLQILHRLCRSTAYIHIAWYLISGLCIPGYSTGTVPFLTISREYGLLCSIVRHVCSPVRHIVEHSTLLYWKIPLRSWGSLRTWVRWYLIPTYCPILTYLATSPQIRGSQAELGVPGARRCFLPYKYAIHTGWGFLLGIRLGFLT